DGNADRRIPMGEIRPMAAAFSHDCKRACLVERDGTIYLQNLADDKKSARPLKPSSKELEFLPNASAVWNSDDSRLWISAPGIVQACLASDGARQLKISIYNCKSLAAHPQDRNLAAGVTRNGQWATIADLREDKISRSILSSNGKSDYLNMLQLQFA